MADKMAGVKMADEAVATMFESPREKMARRISLAIINFSGFISLLGFSIVLTGIYPYLIQMDSSGDKKFLGWIVAANPIAQLFSSPIFGWLGNRFKTVRWLCCISGLLNVLGFSLYALVSAFPAPRKYVMLAARFIVGIAAGSLTLNLVYITKATTGSERTSAISFNAFVQMLGVVLGPVIQSSLVSLGETGIDIGVADLRFNMFTATGWIAACISLVNVFLFLPGIFYEYDLSEKEARLEKRLQSQGELLNRADQPDPARSRDIGGVALCIGNFFTGGFIIILLETLGTPIAIDQLGLSDEEAVIKVGILLSVGCAVMAVCFGLAGPLSKKIAMWKMIIVCGFVPMIIGGLVALPYGGPLPAMQNSSTTEAANRSLIVDVVEPSAGSLHAANGHAGCPVSQEWCLHTPALGEGQLIACFLLIAFGYAFMVTLSTSSMTQLLGRGEQGIWTGVYHSAGSLARFVGPVYISNVYATYGTWATFGSIIAILFLMLAINLCFYRRLIPLAKRTPAIVVTA